ncbi:MAG: hypothetical protein H6509_00270 [Bryobacterales bacterium]|nr:hypothetical protein [Acidobacteriota bacterium]MCB9383019.1 hypothetical protein [Bryobacterales bacterium]
MHSEASNPTPGEHSSSRGNGFESVAAQYRAMQEAQLLHEETINQLREEVRGQRERLAELSKTSPTQKTSQIDMVLVRLSELERKIGEGAPDPLLNEIVHRLAALENAGPSRGARDPRVDDVQAKLEELRKNLSETPGSDSRTDDLVLRIASLEGAFRRAAQSRDAEEVQARIESLATELQKRQAEELSELRSSLSDLAKSTQESAGQSEDTAFSTALEQLSSRLAALESKLGETPSQERVDELGRHLFSLESKIEDGLNRLEGVTPRLQSLEERVEQQQGGDTVERMAERVDALEARFAEQRGFDQQAVVEQIESVRERLDALSSRVDDASAQERLAELVEKVQALEARAAAPAENGALVQFEAKLARFEHTLSQRPGAPEWARLETELNALRVEATQAPQIPHSLAHRLEELETRLSDAESASRLEDADARLGAIESKMVALGDPGDIGRRLTVLEMDDAKAQDPRMDDALVRLAALESKPFETLSDSGLEELENRIAGLHHELERVSNERLAVASELPERLARLEEKVQEAQQSAPEGSKSQELLSALEDRLHALGARVEELAAQPSPEPTLDGRLPELQARLEQVEAKISDASAQEQILSLRSRMDELAAQPATGASDSGRLTELAARIEWIERNGGAEASKTSDLDVEAIKRRLTVIEEKLSGEAASAGFPSGMQAELAARLYALEQGLESLQESAGHGALDTSAALKAETDRWNQWARSTMQEIADLREHVESSGGAASGIDAESVEALSVQISNSLNSSEVKALRGQMYFVYLALGIIWALLMYALFT